MSGQLKDMALMAISAKHPDASGYEIRRIKRVSEERYTVSYVVGTAIDAISAVCTGNKQKGRIKTLTFDFKHEDEPF
jgi:hypothetical protein